MSQAPTVLIPAYRPQPVLLDMVKDLTSQISTEILIVDDGSGMEFREIFDKLSKIPQVQVLRHACNQGKGEALRTGMNHYLLHLVEEGPGVVTADADGQHCVEDILKVVSAFSQQPKSLHLGFREFQKTVPFRSRVGNNLTNKVFSFLVGQKLKDTQTGLRGIPSDLMRTLLQATSKGYEFELEMLIQAVRQRTSFSEIPIRTIYEDGNPTSHFRPLWDSLRIYFVFLRYCAVALLSAGIDNAAFALFYFFTQSLPVSTFSARFISSIFNFVTNKRYVFRSSSKDLPEALKYFSLVIVMAVVSYALTNVFIHYFSSNVYFSKIAVETGLFLLNFSLQNTLIFTQKWSRTLRKNS